MPGISPASESEVNEMPLRPEAVDRMVEMHAGYWQAAHLKAGGEVFQWTDEAREAAKNFWALVRTLTPQEALSGWERIYGAHGWESRLPGTESREVQESKKEV